MPIGTVGGPHFEDFMNPKEAKTTKTHHLLEIMRRIRQASLTADFNGKSNLCLNRMFRRSRNGEFPCSELRRPVGESKKGGDVFYCTG